MASSPLGMLLRHLAGWVEGPALAESSDGQLLERFVTHREEAAFAGLLRRHGPMVLSVCRRALANEQDREDVFQATFLLLARKAGSIRKRESVSSWLHGVAHRLTVRCRAQEERRRLHEWQAGLERTAAAAVPGAWEELRSLLDEAIAELPEKYRSALVLCYLEDHTHEEAARRLGCRLTTLRSRVARGRERLRAALLRRGLALSSAAFLAALATSAAQAALPPSLRIRTLTAALQFANGDAVSTLVSASTAALVEGGLQAMSTVKMKVILVLLLLSGLTLGGAGLLAHQILGARKVAEPPQPDGERAAIPPPESKPQPAVDRFGDPLPEGAIARLGTIRLRHSGILHAVTFSPDGKRLAAISQFGAIRLWDPATGKKLGALRERVGGNSLCVAFSPDGKWLASDRDSGGIWDVATGKKLRNLRTKHLGQILSMQFAPDGRSLVLGTSHDKSIWFYDPATGQALRRLEGHSQPVGVVIFSKDGKILASACQEGTARLWDVATNKVLHEFKHPARVVDIALSPDGKLLAAKTAKGVHLWNVAANKEDHFFALASAPIRSLAFSPDGKVLASEGTLWDVATCKLRCRCQNASGYSTAFSPDGKVVAIGGYNGVISLHDPATGEELPQSCAGTNRGPVIVVRFSTDGKTLITRSNHDVILWDVPTQRARCRLKTKANTQSVELSPDGKMLALVERDGAISLWETATGRSLRRIPGEVLASNLGIRCPALAFSSDGQVLASAGYSHTIRLWRTTTGEKLRSFRGHGSGVVALHFSRDGKTLISAAVGDSVRFWDVASGKQRLLRPDPWVCGISPDGRWYAAGQNLSHPGVRICDLETSKEMCRLAEANSSWCEFSPDGWSIAAMADEVISPEKEERTVLLLDSLTGQVRARFTGHLGFVYGAAFSLDGRTLATVSEDATCLIWDMAGRAEKNLGKGTAYSPKEMDGLWNDLASPDAVKAFRAVRALTASAKQAMPLLCERLRPVTPADGKQIGRWIADLDSDEFQVREQARVSLEKLGELAGPALREALTKTSSAEVRRQARQLLEKLDGPPSSSTLQALRALEVLEHLGTQDARRFLASLAEGTPQARLTREAKAALQRLR